MVRLRASTRRFLPPVLALCNFPVRYGAGPSLCTANLGAEVTRGFWAFARPHVYNPLFTSSRRAVLLRAHITGAAG